MSETTRPSEDTPMIAKLWRMSVGRMADSHWENLAFLLLFISCAAVSAEVLIAGLALTLVGRRGLSARNLTLVCGTLLATLLRTRVLVPTDLLTDHIGERITWVSPDLLFGPLFFALLFLAAITKGSAVRVIAAWTAIALGVFVTVQTFASFRLEPAQAGSLCLVAALVTGCLAFKAFLQIGDEAPSPKGRLLVLLVSIPLLVSWEPPRPSSPPTPVSIWWPSTIEQDYVTTAEGIGWQNIGLFGELPNLLEKAGHRVSLITSLDRRDLAPIVILASPIRPLVPSEVATLRAHVEAGNTLLLVGEHSNLGNVRDVYGPLLRGTGLSLRFDTTNSVFGDSAFTLDGPHMSVNSHVTHNRGASLAISGWDARTLLIGKWWHSDAGNELAADRAFLSDYRLSAGDRLGGLVLAAEAKLKRGRVILWGDSSPFLNQNLAFNSRFILDLVNDATPGRDRGWLWIGCVILAVLFISVRWHSPRGLTCACLLIASCLLWRPGEVNLPRPSLTISDSESNGFDRDSFSPRGLGGLGIWSTRNGLIPWIGNWRGLREMPEILVVVNPHAAPSESYLRDITLLLESGKTVVVSGGGDNSTFVDFAARFGVLVGGPPLGSLRGADLTTYSAWRVSSNAGQPIFADQTQVGMVQTIGNGRMVILADSGFFFSKNIEGESSANEQNGAFLRRLALGK